MQTQATFLLLLKICSSFLTLIGTLKSYLNTLPFKEYLANAEKRTEAAKKESVVKVEVDDLDILTTPEMIMLSAVSGEGVQGRIILPPK